MAIHRLTLTYGLCVLLSFISSFSLAQYVPDQHTVALYHLDEGDGNIAHDASQYHNDGAINAPIWMDGRFSGALEFDDASTHIEIQDSPSLNLNSFTVEAYVRFRTSFAANHRFIVSKRGNFNDASGNYELHWSNDNGGFLRTSFNTGNGTYLIDFSFVPIVDRWYHVAGTFDGSLLKLWLDKELVGQLITDNFPSNFPNPVFIGARGNPNGGLQGFRFKGTIDELRISNIARPFETTSAPDDEPGIATWGRIKRVFR